MSSGTTNFYIVALLILKSYYKVCYQCHSGTTSFSKQRSTINLKKTVRN